MGRSDETVTINHSPHLSDTCHAPHCRECDSMYPAGGWRYWSTDNPKIVGTILGDNNLPASNTQVILMSQYFDPQRDSSEMIVDTTDDRGHFVLSLVDTGVFTIQAVHLTKQTQLLIQGIAVGAGDDSVTTDDATLKTAGTVTIELPDSVDHINGYVYIPGTTIYSSLDMSSQVTLSAVPATTLPSVCYAAKNSIDSRVVRYAVSVSPGSTTEIKMPQWEHAVNIFLNTTASGADVDGTVTNFPLCVRLNSTNFKFNQARPDGGDIRFTKRNGQFLLFETELWDDVAEQAVLWVKVDTIYGHDSSQGVVMYWGNELSVKQSQSTSVFDTTDGVASVLHLGGNTLDASPEGNDGNVCSATDTIGIIGLCKKFNGNDSIMIPGLLGMPSSITLCAWIRQDSV